jgi:hypothetical protein
MLAQLLSEAGRPREALEVLFQARRLNMNSAAARLQYIVRHTFLARDIEAPEVGAADVALELKGSGAPGWILSSSAKDADLGHGEYPRDHPTAKAVLGKRAGDPVVFGENMGLQWKVAAVDSKFAFAFRQSLKLFPARFPTERGLEQHESTNSKNALRRGSRIAPWSSASTPRVTLRSAASPRPDAANSLRRDRNDTSPVLARMEFYLMLTVAYVDGSSKSTSVPSPIRSRSRTRSTGTMIAKAKPCSTSRCVPYEAKTGEEMPPNPRDYPKIEGEEWTEDDVMKRFPRLASACG